MLISLNFNGISKMKWQALFETRERLFWTLHTLGWGGFAVIYYIGSFLHDMRSVWLFVIILNAYAGWLLTIPLRYIFARAMKLSPLKMLMVVLASVYIVALMWALVRHGRGTKTVLFLFQ